jgi:putative transposase
MARPLRIEYEGAFYHVTTRGNEQKEIFFSNSDYEKFKYYLKEAQKKYGYRLHCFALMTNHYHLLIETPNPNLSKVMHYINSSYTNYINIKRGRIGHLFQGRYKALLIDRDNYLVELSRYIHLNPVRAEIVEKPEDYYYSSYRNYIHKELKDIVYCDLILEMISRNKGMAIKRYKDFVEGVIGIKLKNPLQKVYGGMILGGKRFIKETLNKLNEGDLIREDVSHRRALKTVYSAEEVIEKICVGFDLRENEILDNKQKTYRDIAIYLMKKSTGLTNRQIGQLFGNLSYSGVAKVNQRFSEKIKRDNILTKKIEKVMSNVKG